MNIHSRLIHKWFEKLLRAITGIGLITECICVEVHKLQK